MSEAAATKNSSPVHGHGLSLDIKLPGEANKREKMSGNNDKGNKQHHSAKTYQPKLDLGTILHSHHTMGNLSAAEKAEKMKDVSKNIGSMIRVASKAEKMKDVSEKIGSMIRVASTSTNTCTTTKEDGAFYTKALALPHPSSLVNRKPYAQAEVKGVSSNYKWLSDEQTSPKAAAGKYALQALDLTKASGILTKASAEASTEASTLGLGVESTRKTKSYATLSVLSVEESNGDHRPSVPVMSASPSASEVGKVLDSSSASRRSSSRRRSRSRTPTKKSSRDKARNGVSNRVQEGQPTPLSSASSHNRHPVSRRSGATSGYHKGSSSPLRTADQPSGASQLRTHDDNNLLKIPPMHKLSSALPASGNMAAKPESPDQGRHPDVVASSDKAVQRRACSRSPMTSASIRENLKRTSKASRSASPEELTPKQKEKEHRHRHTCALPASSPFENSDEVHILVPFATEIPKECTETKKKLEKKRGAEAKKREAEEKAHLKLTGKIGKSFSDMAYAEQFDDLYAD